MKPVIAIVLAWAGMGPANVLAQAPPVPVTTLSAPDHVFPREFVAIDGVHERSDGTVLLLDLGENALVLLDPRADTAKRVGRVGSGPGEYRAASRLLALGADTSAVIDWGNSRLLLIAPNGTAGGVVDAAAGRGCTPPLTNVRPMMYQAADAQGRLYSRVEPIQPGTDSAAIVRWRTRCSFDTLAHFPAQPREHDEHVSGPVPFATKPLWAVGRDGRVAVVTPDPFRVHITTADGLRRAGPPLPYERVRVSDAVKDWWRASMRRPAPAMVLSRTGESATMMVRRPYEEPQRWPAYLPPFRDRGEGPDAVMFAPDGRLWIQRALVATNQPPEYLVIDEHGRLVQRVMLPPGTQVAGFGNGTVYLVRRDADDVERLERYRDRPPGE